MKKIFLSIAILGLAFTINAQEGAGKLKKATKNYENYSYDKAIEKYTALETNSVEIKRNLATSYYKTGDTKNAEILFAELASSSEATPTDVYTYAAVLKENKKYSESELWMEKFNKISVSDSRGITATKNKGAYNELMKDKEQFTVQNLDINSAQEDFSATYYQDKVLFASSREGIKPIRRKWNWNSLPFLDIYQANKAADNQLSNPSPFNRKLNKKFHEGPVCFNTEETKMVFTRNNYKGKSADGTVKLQLFTSQLQENGKWSKPVAFPYNSNEYSVGHASMTEDGKWMYFASDMPGGIGGVDLYKVEINEDGTYGQPINLGDKINTEGNEMFPSFHKDNMLFFSSNGLVGLGGLDVFVAQINKDASIGKVMNLGAPINTNRDDFSFILDKESKNGYFASNREGGKGDDDIYSFNLLKPITFGKIIKGTAKDKKGQIIADATINLYDAAGKVVQTTTADASGNYQFLVEPDLQFNLTGNKEKYFEGENTASTATEKDVIIADLELEKDPGLSLYALVTNKKSGAALEGVTITLIDNITGAKETFTTPATGDYRKPLKDKKLKDRGSYNLILEKDGYFTKTVTYNTEFDHKGQYDVHANLDLGLDPEVTDLSEMIQINPINFDLNKYNIRPDASVELDKIVAVMNQYPGLVIELGAHTDCRGSKKYNERLSDKRAKASAKYIAERITNPERIYGKGYGEERLLNGCACEGSVKSDCDEATHSENRRTEFKVIKTGNDGIKVNNTSTDSFDE